MHARLETQYNKRIMHICLVVLAISFGTGIAKPASIPDHVVEKFEIFLSDYNKQYKNESEKMRRLQIFADNLKFIEDFNADKKKTFVVGINHFADMTLQEFKSQSHQAQPSPSDYSVSDQILFANETGKDWRKTGCIGPVRNQGQCGSAGPIVTVDMVEAYKCIGSGQKVDLSVAELMDCAANGCSGFFSDYLNWCEQHGIDTAASYPSTSGVCKAQKGVVGAKCGPVVTVPKGNETALTQVLNDHGPVACAIDASSSEFQFYQSGVFNSERCGNQLDHEVLNVGFGLTPDSQPFYILKNSWGASWGMNGYMLLARDANDMCGVALNAVYLQSVSN